MGTNKAVEVCDPEACQGQAGRRRMIAWLAFTLFAGVVVALARWPF